MHTQVVHLPQKAAFGEPDGLYFVLHVSHGFVHVQEPAALQEPVDL